MTRQQELEQLVALQQQLLDAKDETIRLLRFHLEKLNELREFRKLREALRHDD